MILKFKIEMITCTLFLFSLSEVIFVSGSLRDLVDYDKWASPDPTKPTEIFIRTQLRHVNTVDLAQEIFDVDLSIQLRFSFFTRCLNEAALHEGAVSILDTRSLIFEPMIGHLFIED